jgi:hypothetical protein
MLTDRLEAQNNERRALLPEQNLMLAVLDRAIRDYLGVEINRYGSYHKGGTVKVSPSDKGSATAFLFDDECKPPLSLRYIMDSLDWDIDKVRAGIKRLEATLRKLSCEQPTPRRESLQRARQRWASILRECHGDASFGARMARYRTSDKQQTPTDQSAERQS